MARRKRGLSDEDRALWGKVAATATPLAPPRTETAMPAPAKLPPVQRPRIDPFDIGAAARPATPAPHLAPSVSDRVNGAPVRMHHGTHKKMIRGKLKPEARLDLHGLTLARAHPLLIRFVLEAHARELRLVLVITGKGRDHDDGGPIPIRRGALRHQVPSWLNSPPCGAVVLDVRTAHRSHGGEGAYYVYLKRNR